MHTYVQREEEGKGLPKAADQRPVLTLDQTDGIAGVAIAIVVQASIATLKLDRELLFYQKSHVSWLRVFPSLSFWHSLAMLPSCHATYVIYPDLMYLQNVSECSASTT